MSISCLMFDVLNGGIVWGFPDSPLRFESQHIHTLTRNYGETTIAFEFPQIARGDTVLVT